MAGTLSSTDADRRSDGSLVLVAEDVSDARDVICFRLELEGYRTAEAADGREVLEAVHETRPDVLLLDDSIPDFDGWAVLEQLRHDTRAGDVRIAVLTGDASDTAEERAFGAGARAFIAKPVSPSDVARTVDRLLGVA